MKIRTPKKAKQRSRWRKCGCDYCIDGWLRRKETDDDFAKQEIRDYMKWNEDTMPEGGW